LALAYPFSYTPLQLDTETPSPFSCPPHGKMNEPSCGFTGGLLVEISFAPSSRNA